MSNYVCSHCGAEASYDGRCGDGPYLTCGCDRGEWINDGRGGYYDNPTGATAVKEDENFSPKRLKGFTSEQLLHELKNRLK